MLHRISLNADAFRTMIRGGELRLKLPGKCVVEITLQDIDLSDMITMLAKAAAEPQPPVPTHYTVCFGGPDGHLLEVVHEEKGP